MVKANWNVDRIKRLDATIKLPRTTLWVGPRDTRVLPPSSVGLETLGSFHPPLPRMFLGHKEYVGVCLSICYGKTWNLIDNVPKTAPTILLYSTVVEEIQRLKLIQILPSYIGKYTDTSTRPPLAPPVWFFTRLANFHFPIFFRTLKCCWALWFLY